MTAPRPRSSPRVPERFGWLPQLLHWSLALVVMMLIGVIAASLVPGSSQSRLRDLHQGLGLALWGLALLFVLWRMFGRAPRPEPTRFGWQVAASRVVGVALHAFLLVLPPLGYLAASTTGPQVRLFGTFFIPAIAMPPRAELAVWLATSHRILAWSFLAGVFIHVGVALYHHLIVRDRMLERMLPPWSRR